jgi:hypothetical protein
MQNVRQSAQFPLFQTPSPKIPQWEALPHELRQRVVPLLARLLRQHYARSAAAKRAEETCDE